MKILSFIFTLCFSISALAGAPSETQTQTKRSLAFLGGAVVGTFVAGPVGFVVGAVGGTYAGNQVKLNDQRRRFYYARQLEREEIETQSMLAQQAKEAVVEDVIEPVPQQEALAELNTLAPEEQLAEPAAGLPEESIPDAPETAVSLSLYFDTNKAVLTPSARTYLNNLTAYLVNNELLTVRLDGHADRRGKASHNKRLSQKRADSVAKELMGKGVDAERIVSYAYGEELASKDSTMYEKDRRVDIKIYDHEGQMSVKQVF